MARNTMLIVVLVSFVMACWSPSNVSAQTRKAAQPVFTHHYDCDGALDSRFSVPTVIGDGESISISVQPRGLTYFTVFTEYADQAGGVTTKPMHFVLGSMTDDAGEVVISGRIESDDNETSLVRLNSGFLWVSSRKPEGWGGSSVPDEGARFSDISTAQDGLEDPIVSWSLYTLLRSEFTWAGAVATEYIYWIENKSAGHEQVVLYNLEDTKTRHAQHTGNGQFRGTVLSKDHQSRFTRAGGIGKQRSTTNRYDANFVKYVKCRVESIKRHSPGTNECRTSHAKCAP